MTTPTDPKAQMDTPCLFEDMAAPSQTELAHAQAMAAAKRRQGPVRLLEANRSQLEWRASDLDSLLPEDHRARLVWGYVERQDLSLLIEAIKARGSNAGRAAIDPCILFALWLYATLDGVGSGRAVTRLTREHDAYRWICGGVSVNYHVINDFRSNNEALMDQLLTNNVAALAAVGAIELEHVAQDGMRVRANAGAASFRRQASLKEHLAQAEALVKELKQRTADDPGQAKRQAQAAKLRAACERQERIERALEQLPEVAATKRRNGDDPASARASETDADARVMKMGDGGFRPAYNVQFATTCAEQVIVGMDVTKVGSDMAQLSPMVEQVESRLGQSVPAWLVDGGFPAHEQVEAVAGKTELYAPVPAPRKSQGNQGEVACIDQHQRKTGDSDAVAQWRERMGSDEAKTIYRLRAATAECVNAQARNRGMLSMPVRGLTKVMSVVGLFVLAHNLMRIAALAPELIGWMASPPM
jgi:transposase